MALTHRIFSLFYILLLFVNNGAAIWCHKCVSSHPGCGMYDFDWRFYWSHECPDPEDKCVKVIERRGSDVMVTRDCLGNLKGHRRDIPADNYEGCRKAAVDPLLGQYIFPSVPEIDHKREYYTDVTYCFCDFDERCNGSTSFSGNLALILTTIGIFYYMQ